MINRFELAFNDMLTANASGEMRNLLITDCNAEFLDVMHFMPCVVGLSRM